ncbi:MAG: signal peptidase I [Candidatus Thorarchaeota archaeon]
MASATENKRKKYLNKKVIFAIVTISVAFLGSFLVYFILQVSLNTQTPVVVVISGSMEPTIHEGDLLFVKGVNPEDIRNGTIEDKDGDIIVFNAHWFGAPVDPIVHRVVGKYLVGDVWYFITKGDANSSPDVAPVPEYDVIGVVVGGIPYIGWVKIFLTNSGLLIPLLVIISALLIISIIRDVIKGEEKDEKEGAKSEKKHHHIEND